MNNGIRKQMKRRGGRRRGRRKRAEKKINVVMKSQDKIKREKGKEEAREGRYEGSKWKEERKKICEERIEERRKDKVGGGRNIGGKYLVRAKRMEGREEKNENIDGDRIMEGWREKGRQSE